MLKKGQRITRGAFRRAKESLHTGRFVLALDLAASGLWELPRENKPLARAGRQSGTHASLDPHHPPADVPRHLAAVRGYSGRTCREARSRRGLGPITSIPQKIVFQPKGAYRLRRAEWARIRRRPGRRPQLTPAPAFSVGTTSDPQAGSVKRGQALVGAGKPLRTRTRTDIGQCQK